MSERDGGPAFPLPIGRDGFPAPVELAGGMSLRDWFAGQALGFCLREFGGNAEDDVTYAAAAYQIADSMLKERAK